MMRSLWSGVSGLQSHQVAMDVEGDNISNVNTPGYKYSRANFSDMLSQTAKPATAPEGELGGKNAMQVGLGTQIISTQQVFTQGSLQTTDIWSDMAIQGEGFFIISPDGGLTKYYTRNGAFTRDVLGNFVDSNGYIVQGWMRDEDTGTIDPTVPVTNINIEPGLSMPAKPTTEIRYKGNLNIGEHIGTQSAAIYSLDSNHGWLDSAGNGILTADKLFAPTRGASTENDTSKNSLYMDSKNQVRLRERGVDMGVVYDEKGDALNLRDGQGIWVSYADAKATFTGNNNAGVNVPANNARLDININGININKSVRNLSEVVEAINNYSNTTGVKATVINGTQIQLTNQNNIGTTATAKNIKIHANAGNNIRFNNQNANAFSAAVITAYQYTYSSVGGVTAHSYDDSAVRQFTTTEDLREAMQQDARKYINYNGNLLAYDVPQGAAQGTPRSAAIQWQGNNNAFTVNAYNNKNDGVEVTVNAKGQFEINNPAGDAFNEDDYNGNNFNQNAGDTITDRTVNPQTDPNNRNTNEDDKVVTIAVTALSTNTVNTNTRMKDAFSNLNGSLSSGASTGKTSSALKMSAHSMTTEFYDSLGSKHQITVEYRKVSYSPENGTEWSIMVTVPEPGVINNDPEAGAYKNVLTGNIRFGTDGALIGYSPSVINYTANNGSAAGQTIALNFGTLGGFDGITSYDAKSNTENIAQDGYTGGTLNGLRIDQSGKIIGSFTNGHSMALAQVSMATFTNNNGLEKLGGNVWGETANSGGPVIGAASTGSRGKINASTLEMSNVDLSHAFTQLIVIQRGYQANSKTITTSDTMLNTLLQLKQ
ncbi:MAG: flagellar hook protein FlgE [Campylobacter sp.]|uniref:flagellar hook-basal body complex protein n=1 Tax=Campylobacter sp. TaxID=205 RepID=UPI002AA8641A|nr:flagellar hook-basal body complex protein [Campylobacter sp.]MCI7022967.1 flagellar hook protein FlgE [Campylobacter sp.]